MNAPAIIFTIQKIYVSIGSFTYDIDEFMENIDNILPNIINRTEMEDTMTHVAEVLIGIHS